MHLSLVTLLFAIASATPTVVNGQDTDDSCESDLLPSAINTTVSGTNLTISSSNATISSGNSTTNGTLSAGIACWQIASQISGEVYYSSSTKYVNDTDHYMTSSSSASPMCVVEVDNPTDVSIVMKIIASLRIPFAIKSGGHASNPGFSATTGVFISLVRLKQVTLSQDNSTVEIGTGNIWTDVYDALGATNVTVLGARVLGPGVGGVSLGGGYAWQTNEHGLICDNVVEFNIVLPNGVITTVDSSQTELFFALKGGLNRFGVVTSIVLKTIPQNNHVYGGIQVYLDSAIPALLNATTKFWKENIDPKAQIILTVNGGSTAYAVLILFYNGPNRPAAFDVFGNGTAASYSTVKTQSFASFVSNIPSEALDGYRGAFHTLMATGFTEGYLAAIHNESAYYGNFSAAHSGVTISYEIEPFMKYGAYATDSAFPHADSPLPLNLNFAWSSIDDDAFWRTCMQTSVNYLKEVAKREGVYSTAPAYPNYALSTYSGAQLYGEANAKRLRAIQKTYDPTSIMSLAGGFSL